MSDVPTPEDLAAIEIQLGRTPRDVRSVSFRCPCGNPAVVETPPRLSDGTPFPTFYYATCPNLTSEISTLENSELMSEMNQRLSSDPELAAAYRVAHERYLLDRSAAGIDVPEISEISAGGMPDRVKCLHSLIAHSLSVGPGVNPLGDEARAMLPQWWMNGNCLERREQ